MRLLVALAFVLATTAPAMAETDAATAEKKAAEEMRRYDHNNDGVVTYEEFASVFAATNPNIPPSMRDAFVRTAFSRVDLNHDGKIDKLEMAVFIAKNG